MKKIFFLAICNILIINVFSQAPAKPTSAEIHQKIQKLQVLASVLYVAAHPDDENTRMISYFSNERHAETTYLSLTRGDGGQNLVGPEIREFLGLIRTQELLMARNLDGGNQRFTRANDFGYSKHPDETLQLWKKEDVLADVVWAIREARPDVIINRFDHRSPGRTHGHHTSSAMLSVEAFDLTGQASVFPQQLEWTQTWNPQRLFFNTSWWFYGSRAKFEEADKSSMLSVDVGVYYPLLGKSNNEIASSSRSMHKSQGFGSTGSRGSEIEYLELIKGDMPSQDVFDGIDITWNRLPGASHIGKQLFQIEKQFDHTNPSASVPALVQVYREILNLDDDGFWIPRKLTELREVIRLCAGIYIEAVADHYVASPGVSMPVYLEAINRSAADVRLRNITFPSIGYDTTLDLTLSNNKRWNEEKKLEIPRDLPYSSPYWLNEEGTLGMYHVTDPTRIGMPEPSERVQMEYVLVIEGQPISYQTALVFKRNDPVEGEVYRPFEVMPPVYLQVPEDVYIFSTDQPKSVQILVKNNSEHLGGKLSLDLPKGWSSMPASHAVNLKGMGEEAYFDFKLSPPNRGNEGTFRVHFRPDDDSGVVYDQEVAIIEYDHIPTQTALRPAAAKIVRIDLQTAGRNVAYIEGAGDNIPESLRQVGYQVTVLNEEDINQDNLSGFDAVILGVRAYNTSDRIKFYQDELLQYVADGGTLIAQYNTNRRLKVKEIGPYPLQISRDRVAVEEAEMRVLMPEHPAFNFPNKIGQDDFQGWVQERGLYFADEWDERYDALLSSNDPGEPARDGGLLIAEHGKGHFIYSGYSWFRQLPAGVPGAYRLFVNLISLGDSQNQETSGGQE